MIGGPDIAVVVGASGGLGGALAAALGADPRFGHVVGLSRRRPADWRDGARRTWLKADLLNEGSLAAAAERIAELGAPTRIVVATGVLHAPGIAPEKSLRAVDAATLMRLFEVNAVGPLLAARHLLPLTPRDGPSVFAALSARVGSLGDNRLGGWYGYRASKAALNMFLRTAAIEHQRSHPFAVCVALHPGTVATALSAPILGADPGARAFAPAVAAGRLLRVMDGLTPADTGGFFAWDGASVPW